MRLKNVKVKYHLSSLEALPHVVIDIKGLKVYGETEWKTRKHGKDKRHIWRKLYLIIDDYKVPVR
ncbi:hypothetical protein [Candidatus Enterovibrio escicola]|uniref:hypothetical protein n=1 Tax=Candidatus Enterovibrio escicola TaxID=1927127 RepID=UPI0011BA8382|nr:hypothetical protein [Candidatus Enterovibrio escacola]